MILHFNKWISLNDLYEMIPQYLYSTQCICLYIGMLVLHKGFPGGSVGKESTCNAGDLGSIPRSGRSPREGNDNPLQYSCRENSTDRGAWWATGHGVTKSQTRLRDQHLIQNWWLIKLIIDTQGFVMVCSLLSFWLEILHDTFFKRFASRRGKVLISSLKKCLIPPLLT